MPLTSRQEDIQTIRSRLLMHKQQLLAEAEATLTAMPDTAMFPDLGDQASAEIDRNYVLKLRGREQKLLKKIEKALEKIEKGTYGLCESCGAEIEFKRLNARPVTTLCIDCKIEQEEEEKMRED
ncbi:MAG: RNA polymerase-binding protein DksA [Nitrospirae bacterium]|nr:RNA polymerase-binding protein DksA [Nitrospirota bacterium]MBF0592763.1 RNA polymerase-binding protein DksA [Nitrospirota bacterium]